MLTPNTKYLRKRLFKIPTIETITMLNVKQRAESLLFDYETTYKSSYKGRPLEGMVKTEYKAKPSRITRPPAMVKDTHTLTPWKTTIPFSLLHKPKEVVRTNPYKVQQRYEKPEDIDRATVQQTRPRLIMTPAVSMDDIKDARTREMLCRDMYTSATARTMREAVTPCARVATPFPGYTTRANPIVLPKWQPPVVPPEWRMESASWDGKQLRSFCDPTKDFWLREHLPKCRACTESAAIKSHRKMLHQMKH